MIDGTVILTFEIIAKEVILEEDCPENYPIQPKRHSCKFLSDVAQIRPRINPFTGSLHVRSLITDGTNSFFLEQNFVYIHTSILSSSNIEGAEEICIP